MVRTCKICQNTYDYCGHCAITQIPHKQQGMCSNECYEISNILQRYRCNLITANEAALALEQYDVDAKQLQPKIAECYQAILDKATKPVVYSEFVPVENVEVVIIDDEDTTTSDDE